MKIDNIRYDNFIEETTNPIDKLKKIKLDRMYDFGGLHILKFVQLVLGHAQVPEDDVRLILVSQFSPSSALKKMVYLPVHVIGSPGETLYEVLMNVFWRLEFLYLGSVGLDFYYDDDKKKYTIFFECFI
jgi:hypothetical protein